jgi:IS605 OrfB family transposase
MIICRKIKLYPVGDEKEVNRVYKFIRDGMYAQYQALNLGMGLLTSAYFKCGRDIKADEFREVQKSITNSNPIFHNIKFAKGVDSLSLVNKKIKQDFSASLKNGLASGERCINNYKRESPLMTNGRNLRFNSNIESNEDLNKKFLDKDFKVFIKWVNNIEFQVVLGENLKKSIWIRHDIKKIMEGEYKVCESSIQFDDKKIILNLSISIPDVKTIELDENTVVGVDLGIAVPAVCALNNSKYIREFIGTKQDFLLVRVKIQSQLRRERKRLKSVKGGHGRNKKLKSLDRFKSREENFAKTYNHYVSKKVIDFALKNKAKYINLENLTKDGFKDRILRNWSYYQLQQFIEYKAKINGIVVRKVDPYHTSQNCSECGHWEKGQRLSQSEFQCKSCGLEINADFNGARNISKSVNFTEEKSKNKKSKKKKSVN